MPSNITMTTSGYRAYHLRVIEGELYEVWLHHGWEEPKPCVAVSQIASVVVSPNWEILVDGTTQQVHEVQIFRIGTATRPEPPYSFPGVKRVSPALTANETFSVQPMTAPSGMKFLMDTNYVVDCAVNYITKGEPT
jgi:hypothetical protein